MEHCTLEWMGALQKEGYQSRLVSLHPIGGLGPLLAEHGFGAKGLRYKGPAGLFSIPDMSRAFRLPSRPDGVVMSGHNLSAFGALAGTSCKKRVLVIHHHHMDVRTPFEWKIIYAAAMRIFPKIAFCTDFIREEAEHLFPPLQRVSVTLRNPITLPALPTQEDKDRARRSLGIPLERMVVGNAGWLISRKRWDIFLRTAARIVQKNDNVSFLACGDGPLQTELKNLVSTLGLDERIHWLGWQHHLAPFYLSLDVLLFNSDWDALGRTPLEAGSYGVPTVASVLHGGLREVIDSDEIGFLSDRHDEEWLADKTLRLLEDQHLRLRIGATCRQVLSQTHDPKTNTAELLHLLGLTTIQ